MVKTKRIDELISIPKNKDGITKKRKESSQPPETAKEAEKIFDTLWDMNPVLSLSSQMQAVTGLRYSDASWLKYSDFFYYDGGPYKEHVFVIQQKVFNMLKKSNKLSVPEIIKKSTVKVFVTDAVKNVIEECKYITKDSEYLFANKNSRYVDEDGVTHDRPMSVNSAAEYHLRAKKILNLNYTLGTHSWRAYFAMELVKNDAQLVEIRDLLGHLSVNSTNHYLHTFSGRLKDLTQKITLG